MPPPPGCVTPGCRRASEVIGHDSASVDRGYAHMDASAMQSALDNLPDVAA